jgi:hypothetical protein
MFSPDRIRERPPDRVDILRSTQVLKVLMEQTNLRECETALLVINGYLKGKSSFRTTLANLRGLIVLLSENEAALSQTLRGKWRVLEEITAYATYRKLPAFPPESRNSIEATLQQ